MRKTAPAPERPTGRSRENIATSSGRSPAEDIIASSGIAFKLWRLYQHFWLLCLLFPLVALVRAPGSLAHLVSGLGTLVCFAAGYTWLMWPHPVSRTVQSRVRSRIQIALFVVLVALVLALSMFSSLAFLWLLIGLGACAGVIFRLLPAFIVVSLLVPPDQFADGFARALQFATTNS